MQHLLFLLFLTLGISNGVFNTDCVDERNHSVNDHQCLIQIRTESFSKSRTGLTGTYVLDSGAYYIQEADAHAKNKLFTRNDAVISPAHSCMHPLHCNGTCARIMSFILDHRKKMGWNKYYKDVSEFVRSHAPNKVAVEIGTAFGGLADSLLHHIPDLDLHVVDPFLAGYDPKDATSQMYVKLGASDGLNDTELSITYAQAMAYDLGNLHYGCRYHLHHLKSTDAAHTFHDHGVGVIFVDGLHTQAGVEADITMWAPKMSPGGLMIFNDYGSANFPGVKMAVDRLAASLQQEVRYIGESGKQAGNVYVAMPREIARPELSLMSLPFEEQKNIPQICQNLTAMPIKSDCVGNPPARSTFALMLISDAYVEGALCVLERLAGSKYPISVLYNDISPRYLEQLQSVAENVKLVSLEDLAASHNVSSLSFSNKGTAAEWSATWFSRTYAKFFYWLLDSDWVVALDTDMLPLGNEGLDELMQCGGEEHELAAVPIVPHVANSSFNSGLLGLRPSVATFHELQKLAADSQSGAVKIQKVFESGISDQSIFNHKFLQTYRPLPKSFNMERRWWRWCSQPQGSSANPDLESKLLKNTRILHFVGDYKPWGVLKEPDPVLFGLGEEWTKQCGHRTQSRKWWS